MVIFVGDDWAEDHHDLEVVDERGRRLARRRVPEGVEGLGRAHALIGECLDTVGASGASGVGGDGGGPGGDGIDAGQVIIGIEVDHGPWVQALLAAGYQVYAVNPLQVARYRDRHCTSGAKSDPGDAHVLAELVRLDRAHHRPLTPDSPLAQQLKVLARTHQNVVWTRQRQAGALRSMLREYYPAALAAFGSEDAPGGPLAGRDALAVLTVAPGPDLGRSLSLTKIEAALRRGGRQRNVTATATAIQTALRSPQLSVPAGVANAYTASTRAIIAVLVELVRQEQILQAQVAEDFGQHPDAEIYLSQPGIGAVLGARVLSETGDAPNRFRNARARKNHAGTAPITRASGSRRVVKARIARNRRLADAHFLQAFTAINASPGARAHYDAHRARGATHAQALRAVANRLVGILHGCLKHRALYDEATAWPPHPNKINQAAA
jgi:transposase